MENNALAVELVKAHQDFWASFGCSVFTAKDGYIEARSERINDSYANYAVPLAVPSKNLLLEISNRFRKGVVPAFQLSALSHPDWQKFLIENGYGCTAHDTYMTFDSPKSYQFKIDASLKIKSGQQELNNDGIEVFSKVFGGEPSAENPYGNIDPGYIAAQKETYTSSVCRHPIYTIVAYDGQKPVGTGALIHNDRIAGQYGLAVLPEYRGRGIAKAIMAESFRLAPSHLHMLQTEEGQVPFKVYSKMGWKAVFAAFTYTLGSLKA